MKIFTNTRSIFSVLILVSLVFGLQGCSGAGSTSHTVPVFTSGATISVAENNTATGYTALATDADNNTVTYSLTGGTDQAKFSIDSSSGVLSFQAAPDFENPTDTDTNNTYLVEITATDGTNSVVKAVTVIVTNAVEITGFYDTGDISVAGTGNLQGLINGNSLMFYSANSNLLYDGTMTISGANYTANFTVYTGGLSPVTATATGSFVDESSITGVITGGGVAVDGTFNLSFANTNNVFSAASKVVLAWAPLSSLGLDALTIDVAGKITLFQDYPLNSTYIANCTVSSGVAIQPIPSTRLYDFNFTLTNCTNGDVNGSYTGLATTFESTNPDDRLLYMVSNTNKLASLYDVAE